MVTRRHLSRALSAVSAAGSLVTVALAAMVLLDALAEVFAWAIGGAVGRLMGNVSAILGPVDVGGMIRAAIWALLLGIIVEVAVVAVERSRS